MSHHSETKGTYSYAVLALGLVIAFVPLLLQLESTITGFGVLVGVLVAGFSNEIAHYLLHLKEGK